MREIGAFEAKNTLAALLDAVEQGEDVVITCRGRPAAKLVSPEAGFDRAKALAAVQRIKALRQGATLGAGAIVPALWRLEVANGLQAGFRRGRLTATQREAMLAALAELDIRTDPETDRYAWSTTLRLAERHALTLYDASYLELAQRLSLPLASLDQTLRHAASAAGITLLGTGPG